MHARLEGEPLVPDLFIQLFEEMSAEEVALEWFIREVSLEPVHLGPGTEGFRVVGPDRSRPEGYLASGGADTYLIARYEDFDWPGFYQVACSIHFVELVSGQD